MQLAGDIRVSKAGDHHLGAGYGRGIPPALLAALDERTFHFAATICIILPKRKKYERSHQPVERDAAHTPPHRKGGFASAGIDHKTGAQAQKLAYRLRAANLEVPDSIFNTCLLQRNPGVKMRTAVASFIGQKAIEAASIKPPAGTKRIPQFALADEFSCSPG